MKPFQDIAPPKVGGLVKRRAFLAWLRNFAGLSAVSIGPAESEAQAPDGLFFEMKPGEAETPFRVSLKGGKVNVRPGCVTVGGSQESWILELEDDTPPALPTFIGVQFTVQYVMGGTDPTNGQGENWMGWMTVSSPPALGYRATPPTVKVANVNLEAPSCPPVEIFVPLAHLSSLGARQMVSHSISVAPLHALYFSGGLPVGCGFVPQFF